MQVIYYAVSFDANNGLIHTLKLYIMKTKKYVIIYCTGLTMREAQFNNKTVAKGYNETVNGTLITRK